MNNGTDCNKSFTEGKSQNPIINKDDERWTTERLVDQFFMHLDCFTEIIKNDQGQTLTVKKYRRQAYDLVHGYL
jgi:hypothetical protein